MLLVTASVHTARSKPCAHSLWICSCRTLCAHQGPGSATCYRSFSNERAPPKKSRPIRAGPEGDADDPGPQVEVASARSPKKSWSFLHISSPMSCAVLTRSALTSHCATHVRTSVFNQVLGAVISPAPLPAYMATYVKKAGPVPSPEWDTASQLFLSSCVVRCPTV